MCRTCIVYQCANIFHFHFCWYWFISNDHYCKLWTCECLLSVISTIYFHFDVMSKTYKLKTPLSVKHAKCICAYFFIENQYSLGQSTFSNFYTFFFILLLLDGFLLKLWLNWLVVSDSVFKLLNIHQDIPNIIFIKAVIITMAEKKRLVFK